MKVHDKWLERLWQATVDDGVDYLSPVGDRWGELCGSADVAGKWADELVSTFRRFDVSMFRCYGVMVSRHCLCIVSNPETLDSKINSLLVGSAKYRVRLTYNSKKWQKTC